MFNFWNLLREDAKKSDLPEDTVLVASIQWRPGLDMFDDSYQPPREYMATIAELRALPVVEETPPVVHDPAAQRIVLTADKSVREKPDSKSTRIVVLKKGDEAWVIGKKVNGYRQLEDKSGWLYVQGIAGQ